MKCLIIALLFCTFTFTSSQNGCKLADQPFVKNYEIEKLMGRWYLMHMVGITDNDPRGGSYLDVFHEDGKFYVRNTYLSPTGECLPSTVFELRRQEDADSLGLYAQGKKVSDMRGVGGDFVHYGLDHYCNVVKDGVCMRPFVHIWSRTRELPNNILTKAKEEIKKVCLPPNVYNYETGKYNSDTNDHITAMTECPQPETARDTCQLRYIPYIRTLDVQKFLGIWYLAGWFNHAGSDPPADLKGYVINIQLNEGVLYYVTYSASDKECSKLAPVTLRRTSDGGQMRQFGGSHNGSEAYFPYIDYERYLVAWVCTEMDNGVCIKSMVRVWSRTPTLPEFYMIEARDYLKILCKPEREMTYKASDYKVCEHVTSSGAVFTPKIFPVVIVGAICWILSTL